MHEMVPFYWLVALAVTKEMAILIGDESNHYTREPDPIDEEEDRP